MSSLQEILDKGDKSEIRALFVIDDNTSKKEVLFLFNIWSRYFFPQYFKAKDADFHKLIDEYNYDTYRGLAKYFLDVVFRGGSKTTRTKLFISFIIANDASHFRRYIKVLTEDLSNAKQFVTDIYNILISERVIYYYPEIFEKTTEKREETMASFTTATGIKVKAGTVGTDQRGQIQEDARPDWLIFDDFETRKTLRSAVLTKAIWDNMEEAKDGLAKGGACSYLCNYLSERGNVHKLVERLKENTDARVLIQPIIKNGKSCWDYYSLDDIQKIKDTSDDFAGEYLCEPSAGGDVFFDRIIIDKQEEKEPIEVIAGFKMFHKFDPSHRYGSGHDTAGGVGLDSSASVFIDFSTIPARVVGTFKSNTIKPNVFGDEIKREANYFGEPIVAVENNKFDMVIGRLRQIYNNLFFTERKAIDVSGKKVRTYGWNTNQMTKPKMLFDLKKAVEDGHLELSDKDLKAEARSYSRDDLMDSDEDVRLTTRHFDLLTACAIAWQMKDYAETQKRETIRQPDHIPQSEFEGAVSDRLNSLGITDEELSKM